MINIEKVRKSLDLCKGVELYIRGVFDKCYTLKDFKKINQVEWFQLSNETLKKLYRFKKDDISLEEFSIELTNKEDLVASLHKEYGKNIEWLIEKIDKIDEDILDLILDFYRD